MQKSELVETVCGWVGSGLSMFFFVSPIIPLIKLYKKELKVDEIPGILLLCTLISCVLWTDYGLQVEKQPVYICNGIGGSITAIWMVVYWVFFAECKLIPALVYNILFLNVVFECFYICYAFAGKEYNYVIGYIAMVFNVLMFAAPGEKIFQVVNTGRYELLPIYSSICGTFCSTFWAVYGLMISDLNIIIPNVLGMCFSFAQIIVWLIYYRKRGTNPQIVEPINENAEKKDLIPAGMTDSDH